MNTKPLSSPKLLKVIEQNFISELRKANAAYLSEGKNNTSLQFIVNHLPSSSLVKAGKLFQSLVIGGTITKKALCRKTEKDFEIVNQEKEKDLPLLTQKEGFFQFIDAYVDPKICVLGINFAYPMKPIFEHGKLDGILLETSREKAISAQSLIGKKIGKEIGQYMSEKRGRSISVSVGNDTACLLLSGKTRVFGDNLACGVIGTGLNFGLLLDKNIMVNLESADFDKFPQRELGKTLSDKFGSPFGKETNGWSLYRHFNAEIKEKKIDFPLLTSTKQLSEVSQQNISQVSDIAQKHLTHSAQLVACQIAGIADFKQQDMVFVMEGSLFWKGNKYKETVEYTVQQLTQKHIFFIRIPNSGLLGAAKLIA